MMILTLSACDTSGWGFNEQDRLEAENRCKGVGGTIYFSKYLADGSPMWASCFVQGFKYQINKDGEMFQ